jgi:hypothetical protein
MPREDRTHLRGRSTPLRSSILSENDTEKKYHTLKFMIVAGIQVLCLS